MRTDSAAFALYDQARAKAPRFVVRIGYDVDSLAITSHSGITGVTAGTILEGMLAEPTVTSQRLRPDDAVAEIGSASFALIDKGGQFTSEVRDRLNTDGAGLRGKTVQFYVGYEQLDFADFRLVATQIVSTVNYDAGRYEISCLDIQRALRAEIFSPVLTTLSATVEETDTVISVSSTAALVMVSHGSGWSDAPNQTVGYIKIKSEIIRYTAIVGNQLFGCTRGMFNTVAAKYVVDAAVVAERREKVSEFIYLELPAVKLAYAVLTGVVPGNLLGVNGGMEVDTNADGAADFWQNYSNTNTYSRVTGRSGTGFAQRFQTSGGSTPRMGYSIGIYIKPGRSFTVSAWINAPVGQTAIISAKGYTSAGGGETVTFSNGTAAGTGTWQRVSRTFVSSAVGPYVRPVVGLGGTPAAATVVIFDDVQLELATTASADTTALGGVLPDHWSLGVDQANVRTADFVGIGADLWDPSSDNAGFPLRFDGLSKTDGKRFLEKELYLCAGLFSPVYSDGVLGLRRMIRLLGKAAMALTLDHTNVVSCSGLQHDMRALHNAFVVNWSWNGTEFRRATSYLDAASAAKHGEAETLTLNFKGLHGAKHTDGVVIGLLGMLRDRYAGPPERTSLQLLPSLNRLEVGDVVRVRLPNVRDFAAGPEAPSIVLDRAFEIQNVSVDYRSGVSVELFGSTSDPAVSAPTTAATSLPDAFYTAAGTALSSVPGVVIAGNVMTAAPAVLAGNALLNNAGAIYYHNADLTIAAGVNLVIADNVQLRVKGFLTVNGTINGSARGLPGVTDTGGALVAFVRFGAYNSSYFQTIPGNPGFLGSSRGHDGVVAVRQTAGGTTKVYDTRWAALAQSRYPVAPRLLLTVSGNSLLGLPDDLRGTGGPPGGRAQVYTQTGLTLQPPITVGGAGGNGGAGLAIVCRGMGFGVNGFIDLSGANTATPATPVVDGTGMTYYPGVGGPGGPGAMYVLLDGASLSIPDLSGGKFRAKMGTAAVLGTPMPKRVDNYFNNPGLGTTDNFVSPSTGWRDPDFDSTNALDMSGTALVVQYIPGVEVPTADQDSPVLPVTLLSTESAGQAVIVTLGLPATVAAVEVYASATNDRSNATKVFDGYANVIRVRLPDGATRYFWARTRNDAGVRSAWYPLSSTAGIVGSPIGGLVTRGQCEAFGDVVQKNGGAAAWDSDAYSVETFAGGVFVSFQAAQTNAALMVGLNADPNTDSSFASLDYAWYCRTDGVLQVYESGSAVNTFGSYTTSTSLQIRYDGQQIQYVKDGAVVRTVQAPGLSLFVDSSFNVPGGAIRNLKYGAMTTAATPPWIARGNCSCTLNTITKVGGANAYDSDCYSQKIYENGCIVTFQVSQLDKAIAIGLNSDPSTDQNFTGIDYCWVAFNDGVCRIWESGVFVASYGAYTINTVFTIKYDGQQVIYLLDGVVVRTVPLRGALFFMDSSIRDPGGTARNVEFGPLNLAPAIPFLTLGGCVATLNTLRKVSGAAAFDAGAYSTQAFDACSATAQPNTGSGTGNDIYFGLNTDPLTDLLLTTLDYGFRFGGGSISAVVNGTSTTLQTGYATTDVCTIKYDGETVRWYINGAEVKALADPGKRFFFDSGFSNVGAMLVNVEFKSLTASAAVPFTCTGTAVAGSNSIKKTANTTNAWDAQAYSVQPYEAGCYLTFQVPATTGACMLGLNTDPTTDADYASIDYAFSIEAGGTYKFYESGVAAGSSVAFAAGATFGVRYDGQQIQYLVNGVVVRTVATVLNKTFYFDSSLYTAGVEIKNVSFRPLTTAPTSPWVARGFAVATATTVRKIGGATGTFDSDVYSTQAYRAGCVVSAVPDSTAGGMYLGLDDSPAGGMALSTLEHAFYCNPTGQGLQIYESNSMVLDLGAAQFDLTTALAIVYDGQTVRYLRNGTVVREVFNPGKTFFGRMALRDTGGAFKATFFGALSGATPVPFIARTAQCHASDTSAQKIAGGTTGWDADVVSIVGYPRAYLQFKASQTNAALVVGLNSDPYTDSNYTSIDAAFYLDASGNLFIYESGTLISAQGTYTASTHLVITYDGTSIRYYKDNALLRTQAMSATLMFLDTSFYTPGGAINSLKFGPGTVPPRVDTGDLNTNSATEIYQTYTAGPFSQAAAFSNELITIHSTTFQNNNVGAMVAITVTFRSKRPNFVGTEYLRIYVQETGFALPIYAQNPSPGYATQGDTTNIYFSYTVRLLAAIPDNKSITIYTMKHTFGFGYTETFNDITTHVEVLKR